MYITTTFAYWEMLLSTTIIPGLVIIVKRSVEILAKLLKKLLTGGQKLAPSLRVDLDGELIVERNYRKSDICIKNKHT